MRTRIAALAVVFLAGHLFVLPPTLEDIDSVNFALGVREFDVANHQPHPPGYPVFIALAKASTAVVSGLGIPAPNPRALALLGVIAGTIAVPLLFALFRPLDPDLAWWATLLTVCSPLFWFTALRPLSDMTGVAAAIAAQALLLSVFWPARRDDSDGRAGVSRPSLAPSSTGQSGAAARLMAGAAVAGLAAGVRSQTVLLTTPLLVAALCWPRTGVTAVQRAAAAAIALLGAGAWAMPLIVASGGLGDYLAALGTQAGEDFHGVTMLWTTRHPRAVFDALLHSFVWPWGGIVIGSVVVVLAAAGCVRAAVRAPRMLVLLVAAFGPYALFHLLFQETRTQRYALPLVVPMALMVVYAARGLGRSAPAAVTAALAVVFLALTLPATRAYARDGSPAFRLFEAAVADAAESPEVIGMHAVARRIAEWHRRDHRARVLEARHGREWLALLEHWRGEPESAVTFLADPRRSDLALFDPRARQRVASARWSFPELPFVAGVRPGATDVYVMRPPGWMLHTGWALTAEVGGVTAAMRAGPHLRPSVAWIRARPDGSSLLLGGRHMLEGAPPVRLALAIGGGALDTWEVRPGAFVRHVEVPAGALSGAGYVPLRVEAAVEGAGPVPPVALEQFDLQPGGVPMHALSDGWHEPEYNPATGRSWRWMSERAQVWIRSIDRDVTLTVSGESPLRYFDRPPRVRVTAGGVELASFTPDDDFTQDIVIPASAVGATGGLVAIETDLWFVPADRDGVADRRHLGLRVYEVRVR